MDYSISVERWLDDCVFDGLNREVVRPTITRSGGTPRELLVDAVLTGNLE